MYLKRHKIIQIAEQQSGLIEEECRNDNILTHMVLCGCFVSFLDCSTTFGVMGTHMGEGRSTPGYHRRTLCEHLWVRYLAQGYLGITLKVFRNLPYYQNTFSTFQNSPQHTELPWLQPSWLKNDLYWLNCTTQWWSVWQRLSVPR